MKCYETEVVVVGCGIAGMAAALSALEAGAKVISVERSTFDERGGNSRWTDANLLVAPGRSDFELLDMFWDGLTNNSGFHVDRDMMAETANDYDSWHPNVKTGPFLDPVLLETFGENVPSSLEWLQNHGVKIDIEGKNFPFFIRMMPFPQIYGGGLNVIETLTPRIQEKGGEFIFETTATELLIDEMGRIYGLRGTTKNNEPVEIKARAVILASGGFQGNPQMLAQYCGKESKYVKPVCKGGYYNKGEGLRMALAINAAPAGDWSEMHRQMVDPRSTQPEALVHIWQGGIVVNQHGERFMDECPSNFSEWHEPPGRAIMAQPGGIGYIIYDEQLNSGAYQGWRAGNRSEVAPIVGNTLQELAEKLEIPAKKLEQTVAKYNRACVRSDSVQFNWDAETFSFGGVSTEGVEPPKSNYAKKVEIGPFYCYPMIASICMTLGGLRVNANAQVLNYSAEIIPGLYAAGETVGMHYGDYTGGTSAVRALTFGRLAGDHAASII
jgi:tricarballylate dehydrogenase